MTKKPSSKESTKNPDAQDSYASIVHRLILLSLGRIPTGLVVVFLGSLGLSVMVGVILQLSQPTPKAKEFMPYRLDISTPTPPLDIGRLKGTWVYQSTDFAMTLTMIGNKFEWIAIFKEVPEVQYYARGNFRVDGDVMVLGVRTDMGKPYDPNKPWVKFIPIAMKDVNVRVLFQGANLVWDIPLSEQRRIISQTAQIFLDNPSGRFEWVRQ